jgi:hypothetical protein
LFSENCPRYAITGTHFACLRRMKQKSAGGMSVMYNFLQV